MRSISEPSRQNPSLQGTLFFFFLGEVKEVTKAVGTSFFQFEGLNTWTGVGVVVEGGEREACQ